MAAVERNLVKTPSSDEPTLLRPGALVPQSRMRLGEILVASGQMSAAQVDKVLEAQTSTDRRFGEIAIRLGFVKRDHVERALGLQFGYSSSETEARLPAGLTVLTKPASPFSEALRGLRSQLGLRWFDKSAGQSTLAITSVDRGDGKSFVTANLGVMFSQLGQRTIVIDADLRHSTQHTLFGLPNRMGLSGILSGRAGFEEILEVPRVSNMWILPAGPLPPNPLELLGRETFPILLDELESRFDVILIDTPSAQQASDAQIIAERAKGALIVARKDKTKTSELGQLAGILSSTGVTLLGTMLNEY